jgi:hypothetical protein
MKIVQPLTTKPLRIALPPVLLMLLGFLGALANAKRSPASFSLQDQCPPSWVTIQSDDFSVEMPVRVLAKPAYMPQVEALTGVMYRASERNVTYTVWSVKYAGDADSRKFAKFRSLYRESLVLTNNDAGTRLKVIGQQSLDGNAGEQLQVVSGGKLRLLYLYARGERLYALEVSPALEGDARANCFLSSFRFSEPKITDLGGRGRRRRGGGGPQPNPWPTPLPIPWPTPRPTPIIRPTPTPLPSPTPIGFFCECERGYGKEVEGDALNHDAVLCPMPKMEYTQEAILHQYSGSGLLKMRLTKDGEAIFMEVVQGLPYGLTANAIKAARKIKFCPAMENGEAVDTILDLTITFEIVDELPARRPAPRKRP